MIKFSRQRESIKNNLMGRTDHPTAETVYSDIRQEYPNISLGTVYRNLSLLADFGRARLRRCRGRFERHRRRECASRLKHKIFNEKH